MDLQWNKKSGCPHEAVLTRQICSKTHFARTSRAIYGKTVRFLAFLTSEMDSATSNYVINVVHSFGQFSESDLFDNVIYKYDQLVNSWLNNETSCNYRLFFDLIFPNVNSQIPYLKLDVYGWISREIKKLGATIKNCRCMKNGEKQLFHTLRAWVTEILWFCCIFWLFF